MRLLFPLALAAALLSGCATTRPYLAPPAREEVADTAAALVPDPAYQIFLVGDTGAGEPGDADAVLDALRARLLASDSNGAVVFLGDQLPAGMPDSGAVGRGEAEARLRRLAEAVEGYAGRVFVVPGDRDWRGGPDAVRRQERFLEGLLGRDDAFLPGDALPGPVVVELGDDRPVLVALDTQWWLEDPAARPTGETGDVDVSAPSDVLQGLEDVLAEYDEDNVLVVGHHPVRSNGPRAGRYPLATHLLPPVLGSAVPFYRAFIGGTQDLASPRYRTLRLALERAMRTHDGGVYAAAHEHALGAYRLSGLATRRHFLISGAAADADPVAPGGGALYAHGTRGFLVLRYGPEGQAALEAVTLDAGGAPRASPVAEIRGAIPGRVDQGVPDEIDPADLPPRLGQTVTAAADSTYLAGPVKRFFFGRGYREAWAAPVEVPVLDVGRDFGGLVPLERGGGLQSVSIRFEGGDGHTYQIRLLQKRAADALPPELQTAAVRGIVRDQTSATNPYGALAAAHLARAAGVYHAEPRLFYIPDDPRLGRYREVLAGQLGYVEIRPDDDMSDRPEFGRSDDVVSSAKLREEMREDHDHRVDQRAFLRARLVDILIGDWDRHDDQWRWAGFDPGLLDPTLTGEDATRGKVYLPIPRDRDFAFYRIGGLFPGLARYFQAKLQNYEEDFGDLRGLTYNAVPLDRLFLSELTWAEWEAEVAHVRAALTDDVVSAAFHRWPAPVYARYGPEAEADFHARLADLPAAARAFYGLLARSPDVLGSDERERFVVRRLPDGATEVAVHHASDDGEAGRELFRRTFHPNETHEVRLYAMGDRDWLSVEGDGPARVRIRFIGGAGEDTVEDRAGSGNVVYYDTREGNDADGAGRVAVRLSDAPDVNRYDPFEYERYVTRGAYPSVGYDRTDGVIVGAGYRVHVPRFRGAPRDHDLLVRYATSTGGVAGRYALRDPDRWGRGHGLALTLDGATPRNVRNFYGFGNETAAPLGAAAYRVPVAYARAEAAYARRIEDRVELRLGPTVSYTDVHFDSTRFASMPASGLGPDAFEPQVHGGAAATLALASVDDAVNPRQGLRWTTRAAGWAALNDAADSYGTVGSDLTLYLSPVYRPQLTLALRAGAAHAFGDVPFFDAPALGGSTLRGYRRERFTGRTAVYQSAELRVKLFDLSTALLPFEVGALGFLDNGRVWADGDASSAWHQGYGGGLWLGVANQTTLTATVGVSPEETLILAGLGFAF